MGGRRILVAATICLVALVAASCSEGDRGGGRAGTSQSDAPADFMDKVEELCAPVAEEHEAFEGTSSLEDYGEAEDALLEAEGGLVEGLRELDAPPDVADDLDAYVEALEESSRARQRRGKGATEAESLEALVEASEAAIRMEEAATAAGLPDECPPPPSVDVHNTLFVTRANLACHNLIEEIGGEAFDPPRTPEELALVIDIARRLTARIAGVVEESATPGMDERLVKKVVRWNKKRFRAIDTLVKTIRGGDYGVYRKAGRKLAKVSREVDRKMLSLGLAYCAKAFGVVPL